MAGTFTHWMVVEKALNKFDELPTKYPNFDKLLTNNHFVILGAVGPDYPYLSEVLAAAVGIKEHSWADRMHYENTDDPVKYGATGLAKLSGDDFNICLSWLCGFTTHLLIDSVIHPVVQAIVGPYIFNSGEHRKCEMVQDSMIFKEVKGIELVYDDYFNLLKMCSDPSDQERLHPAVSNLWTEVLKMSHPGGVAKFPDIQPDLWHKNFLEKIDIATHPSPIAIFRHVEESGDVVYRKTNEIPADEKEKYFTNINLPGSKKGDFITHAFNKAIDEVVDVWQKLLVDINNGDYKNCATYLRNWDLDTGVDQDSIFFWN